MRMKKVGRGQWQLTVERKSILNIKVFRTYCVMRSDGLWSVSGGGYVKSGKRLVDVLLFCSTKDNWI
jgi:hypothetical protein